MKSNENVDLVFKLYNIEFKLNDNQYVGGFRYNNKNIKREPCSVFDWTGFFMYWKIIG